MRVLGAILAGGQSRRFGSDKAHALCQGQRLIDRVAASLSSQCATLVICGREEGGFQCLADQPEPGHGPLGGLNAALHYAVGAGFDCVLSCGCDVPNLPDSLLQTLGGIGPAIVDNQPVVGVWPAGLASICAAYLVSGKRSLYGFAECVQATRVRLDPSLQNINRPSDLLDQ